MADQALAGKTLTGAAENSSAGPDAALEASHGERLPEAAKRALAEAAARRRARAEQPAEPAASKENQGRGGLDPVRYNDWEVKGRAIDF